MLNLLNFAANGGGTTVIIILIILLVIFIIIALSSIRVVRQSEAVIVERLGRYHTTWNTGIHWLVPFIDRVKRYRSHGSFGFQNFVNLKNNYVIIRHNQLSLKITLLCKLIRSFISKSLT